MDKIIAHMKIEQLNEIVKQANTRKIARALRQANFRNCKLDRRLRKASLCDIAAAPYEETPYYSDGKGTEYVGDLCRDVRGYEQHEFIIVQVLSPIKRESEVLSTTKILIYARKINETYETM